MGKILVGLLLLVAVWSMNGKPAFAGYPPPNGSCPLTSSATVVPTGGTVTLSTTVRDVNGVPIPFVWVSFGVQPGSGAHLFTNLTGYSTRTNAQGSASIPATVGPSPGIVVFGSSCYPGSGSAVVSVSVGGSVDFKQRDVQWAGDHLGAQLHGRKVRHDRPSRLRANLGRGRALALRYTAAHQWIRRTESEESQQLAL